MSKKKVKRCVKKQKVEELSSDDDILLSFPAKRRKISILEKDDINVDDCGVPPGDMIDLFGADDDSNDG